MVDVYVHHVTVLEANISTSTLRPKCGFVMSALKFLIVPVSSRSRKGLKGHLRVLRLFIQ